MRGGLRHAVRLRWAKHGKVRWIGHRDVARAFERAFRIEALPLAFTEGFNPHPKVSFGLALSVGYESDVEYLDVALTEPVDLDRLPARISSGLPVGMDVISAVPLAEGAPSLQEAVSTVSWRVVGGWSRPLGPDPGARIEHVRDLFADALAAESLPVRRRRKGREVVDDVRPAVRSLCVASPVSVDADGDLLIEMVCDTRPRCPKPTEVLEACATATGRDGLECRRVWRTAQIIERDGVRFDPLDADRAPREPEVRAS